MKLSLRNVFLGTIVLSSLYEQVEGILFGLLRKKEGGCDRCDFDVDEVERIIEGLTKEALQDIERARDQAISDIRYERQNQHHHHQNSPHSSGPYPSGPYPHYN